MSRKNCALSKKIGETLKNARLEKGYTLKELAKLVDSSAGHLSDIENNKTSPGSEILISLQRNLGFDIVADPEASYHVTKIKEGLTPMEKKLLDSVRGEEDDFIRDVLKYSEKEKLFKSLMEKKAG